jgi:hypothetical protein
MRGARLLRLMFLAILLAVPIPFFAQSANDNVLTNADVVRMVHAGLPESIIVQKIQMSRTNFSTSASALIELKNQGASERVLGAVLDSQAGPASRSESAPIEARSVAPASTPSGPHHMPTFQANLRVNSTVQGKLSMKKNEIKFERSGVPLFSLKWKEPAKDKASQ